MPSSGPETVAADRIRHAGLAVHVAIVFFEAVVDPFGPYVDVVAAGSSGASMDDP